jgi:hypothetical protein
MTTPQELEDQINREDILPYLNKVYDGFVTDSLIEQFRIAMMHLPVTAHKYSMEDVEIMSLRRPGEVTNRELGLILNVVFAVPFVAMYESLEEGIEKTKVFEKIKDEYNKSTAAFQRKCDAKMKRLMSLSGVGNSMPLNGMKVIPK